jgi:integrase
MKIGPHPPQMGPFTGRNSMLRPARLTPLRAGLPPAGVHILRHSAAKLQRDVGESVEDVSRFLDHSSLAVTTVYLRRLEGQEDRSWGKVAEAIGV